MLRRARKNLTLRVWSRRVRRFVVHQILHADDPPHRLALGIAIGIFVTFTPTVGFQMALVVLLAWLLRANKVVGLPVVWISNPATIVPIFWPCYVVGQLLLGTEPIDAKWWHSLAHPPATMMARIGFYTDRFMEVFWTLWVGGIVVGLAVAYPTYYIAYYSIRAYRLRKWGQLTPPPK